uniref:Late embryogenesis abundant protein LEA-2 subgroup domain-containing protein n=1 Tax=Leersia perrieri TaxID=77586 RepID=A0A0D9XBP0_9ORYZ
MQKVFAFLVKQLSNLWGSSLILLVAWQLFLRPSDVEPKLGASVVRQFELMPAAGSMELRFNITPSLLIKSTHGFYTIRFNHLAAAVFYAGEKLGPVDDELPPFKQKSHTNVVMDMVLAGWLHNASSAVVKRFAEEKVAGRFEAAVVTIRTTLTYKFWPYKADYFYIYECPLSMPAVPRDGGELVLSSPSTCKSVKI